MNRVDLQILWVEAKEFFEAEKQYQKKRFKSPKYDVDGMVMVAGNPMGTNEKTFLLMHISR